MNKDFKKAEKMLEDVKQVRINALVRARKGELWIEENTEQYSLALKDFNHIKHDLKEFKIITKIPKFSSEVTNIKKWINEEIESSLLRLNKNKIHAILFHHPNDLKKSEGKIIYESLKKFKDQNIISKLGVSIYSPDELDTIFSNFDFAPIPTGPKWK